MGFRADLHIHSHYSDGTNSPEEILHLAKKRNLNAISITDHDTILAYSKKLFTLAKELNIILLPGVEISSEFENESVHILAYDFDLHSKPFISFLKKVREKRKVRNLAILKKLNEKNIAISQKDLENFAKEKNISNATIGRVHIATVMMEKGYVKKLQEAFDLYIKDDAPCYVKGHKFSPKEIIDQIHLAKGKAVLAHPNVISSCRIVKKLLEYDFDGIEVYYSKLLPAVENRWKKIALAHNLLITGGSDFHGSIRPYNTLGCSWIDENEYQRLVQK